MNQEKPREKDVSFKMTPALEREWLKESRVMYGGLIAAGLIFIQPFLYKEQFHGLSAQICVISFAIAIPILAALILLNEEETFHKHPSKSKIAIVVRIIGQDAAYLGIIAGFWHIDKVAGISAIAASVIGMSAHSAGLTKLYSIRANKRTSKIK